MSLTKNRSTPPCAEDSITAADMIPYLGGLADKLTLHISDTVPSTNTEAKRYAEGRTDRVAALFIANGQTGGRGRRGRSFLSSRGKGVYMSLLCYPEGAADRAVAITAYTAVAVCKVIERLTGERPGIKWVNDIYLGGKKIAGILTEGSVSCEDGSLDFAVIGIGINVYKNDFGELSDIATDIESATGIRLDRARLAALITEELLSGLDTVGSTAVADEYRRRQIVIGREVRVIKPDCEYTAEVLDVTDSCRLRLRLADGSEELLSTGEVSLKLF